MQEIQWWKSSFSGGGNPEECIEVASHNDAILVRESDDPQAVVTTSREKLRAFVLGVKAGEFDHLI